MTWLIIFALAHIIDKAIEKKEELNNAAKDPDYYENNW